MFSEFLEDIGGFPPAGNRKGKMMALDLKVLMQRKAKLESDIARARKKETDMRRREDSRRKIVLGSVILAAVRKGGISENAVRGLVDRHASDRDKTVFENFDFEVAGAEASASESITTNAESHAPGE